MGHATTNSIKRLVIELGRIVRFGIVGLSAAAVYFCSSLLFSHFVGPLAGTTLAFVLAALVSYFGHQRFSFAVAADHRTFGTRFAVITLIGFVVNVLLTWIIAVKFEASQLVPMIAVMVMLPVINYLCNRFWVFVPGLRSADMLRQKRP